MCAAADRETFKMLPGSNTDDGARYEYLMCSYVALKLSQDESTRPDSKMNYKLSSNSVCYGKFDDVIVEITEKNVTETWAAQLKHKANQKPITKNELCGVKGDFSINMYFEDYKKRQNLPTAIKSVLFTNKDLEAGKSFKLDGKPYLLTTVKSNTTCPLDTSNDCSVYQFYLTLETEQQVDNEIDEYKTFLNNFYICASQKNADEIEEEVSNLFTKVYGSDRVDKYKTFFETWWREIPSNKMKLKLYKKDIEIKIAKMVLEPLIIPTNESVSCPKAEILKTIISKFDITLIDTLSGDDLVEHLSRISDSGWNTTYIPKAISVDKSNIESVCKSVNILSAHHNFVLVGECVDSSKFNDCKVFRNLLDLNDSDYMDVTTNFYCVVQGRKLSPLHEILESNPKLKGYFTLSHLLNMMDEKKPFVIGDATVELPKNYIERSLPKHIFSCDLITALGNSEVLVISCCEKNEREKIEILKNSRTLVIDITNRDDYVIEPEREEHDEKINHSLILVSENKVSLSKLSEICSKIDDERSVLNVEFLENSLNLLSTHGTSSKFMRFRKRNTHETIRDLEILSNFMSRTNVLVADPGMGKTICADLIKQICPFDAWPVKINLREKLELFENCTGVQDLLAKVVCTDAQSIMAKHFRDYYCTENKFMLIWDGIDEIGSEQNIDLVIDLIKKISCDTHHYQWITSRYHLKEKLESFFGIESITLVEAAENEQRKYIKESLQEVYGENIQDVTDGIYESIAKSNLKDMLGIPLLLNMFTTICSNIDHYKRIRENEMSLTQIYAMFVDAKFEQHFFAKIVKSENTVFRRCICKLKADYLTDYSEAALMTCFDSRFVGKLNFNCDDFIQAVKQSGDFIGLITIITDNNTPIFLHKTFAEYFSAIYLAKNYKQIDKEVVQQLFQPEYRNIRFLFDMYLSENHPAHLAVLAMNLDKLKEMAENQEDRHLWENDEGGRNVLHLASSYGTERRPLEQLSRSDARLYQTEYCRDKFHIAKVFDSTPLHSFEAENKVYEEIIEYLVSMANQKQRTINYKDNVYELNCVGYADASFSLHAVETLLKISEVKENCRLYFCYHKDIETLVAYSIVLGYQNLLSVFEHIPYFELFECDYAIWDKRDRDWSKQVHLKNVFRMYNILLLIIEFGGTDLFERALKHYLFENWIIYRTFIGGNPEFSKLKLIMWPFAEADALSWAVKKGNLDIFNLLIQHDVFLNKSYGVKDDSILHIAVEFSKKNMVKHIADKKVVKIDIRNGYKQTPLMVACEVGDSDIYKYLIEKEAKTNVKNSIGQNLLHISCKAGHLIIVQDLVENKKINLESLDFNGKTPLLTAVQGSHFGIVQYLLKKGSNLKIQDKNCRNVLHYVCNNGSLTFIQSLTKEQLIQFDTLDKDGNNPLLTAAEKMHFDIVKYLLENGSNLEVRNKMRRNVLHYACYIGFLTFIQSLTKKQLIQLDTPDNNGNNPLLTAAKRMHFDIVKYLLGDGSSLGVQNEKGRNVLHYACEKGSLTFIQSLTKEQLIQLDTPDYYGNNPLLTAAEKVHFDIVKYLLENGSNLEVQNEMRRNVLHYACEKGSLLDSLIFIQSLTKEQLIQLDTPDKNGYNLSLTAAKRMHFDIVEYLLGNGSNLEVQDEMGRNVLHYACEKGSLTFIQSLTKEQLIQLDTLDIYVKNPLLIAAEKMHFDIVKYLLENGSNLKVQDEMRRNVLHYACEKGSLTFIQSFTKEQLIQFDTPDYYGNNPLLTAAEGINFDIVKYLLENGSNLEVQNEMRRNVLHYACQKGSLTFIQSLTKEQLIQLDTPDYYGNNPLLTAAEEINFDIVEYLLENVSNLEVQNEMRRNVLHYACEKGSLTFIQSLTKKQLIQLDTPDYYGNNPLLTAAKRWHFDIVKYLLGNGKSLGVENEKGRNVLHYACKKGSLTFIQSLTIEQLIRLDTPDYYGNNPLLTAAEEINFDIVEYLLENGSNLEVQNEMRRNVLHYACMEGSLTFIQSLTKKQLIQLDTLDNYGKNPLLIAAEKMHFDIVKYLLENGSNLKVQDRMGRNVLHHASEKGSLTFIQSLTKEQLIQLDTPDNDGNNPLLTAAKRMHFDIVKYLLGNGSSLGVQNEKGRNVLHYACEKGSLTFIQSLTKEQLIQLDTPDYYGNNPLLTAAEKVHFDIVKYLLENGSNLEVQNEMRRNVLHYACEYGFSTFIQSITKEQLIQLDTLDNYGKNPLLIAAEKMHFDIVKYLLENGSNLEVQDEMRKNVLHYACEKGSLTFMQSLTKKQLIQLDTPDKNGNNPLLTAAEKMHFYIVKYLLENGSNLKVQDRMGTNVLHCACEKGFLTFIQSLTKEQLIQLDTPDKNGNNPLLTAAEEMHFDIVKYLLENGSNLEVQNKMRRNVLHYACETGSLTFIQSLTKEQLIQLDTPDTNGFSPLLTASIRSHFDIVKYLWENSSR